MPAAVTLTDVEAKKLGQRLSVLRKEAGLTQEAAAEKAGITPRHLQRIEAGHRVPSLGLLASLRRVLRVKWTDLFEGV